MVTDPGQYEALLGPLGVLVALIIAVAALATGRVMGKGASDDRVAAEAKLTEVERRRGDEWKASAEQQAAANIKLTEALDKNTEAVRQSAQTTEALVDRIGRTNGTTPRRSG